MEKTMTTAEAIRKYLDEEGHVSDMIRELYALIRKQEKDSAGKTYKQLYEEEHEYVQVLEAWLDETMDRLSEVLDYAEFLADQFDETLDVLAKTQAALLDLKDKEKMEAAEETASPKESKSKYDETKKETLKKTRETLKEEKAGFENEKDKVVENPLGELVASLRKDNSRVCGFTISDPKGELLNVLREILEESGYKVKTFQKEELRRSEK